MWLLIKNHIKTHKTKHLFPARSESFGYVFLFSPPAAVKQTLENVALAEATHVDMCWQVYYLHARRHIFIGSSRVTSYPALVPLDKTYLDFFFAFKHILHFLWLLSRTQLTLTFACLALGRDNKLSGPPLTGLRAGHSALVVAPGFSPAEWVFAIREFTLCGFYGSNSIDLNVTKQVLPPEHLTEAWRSMSSTSRVAAFLKLSRLFSKYCIYHFMALNSIYEMKTSCSENLFLYFLLFYH